MDLSEWATIRSGPGVTSYKRSSAPLDGHILGLGVRLSESNLSQELAFAST
jgi:hypothetical protein